MSISYPMKMFVVFVIFSLSLFLVDPQDTFRITDTPGLHNVIRVTEKLLSGSVPEGDEGFQTLQKLGVKTIITVDGAKPEVERAKGLACAMFICPLVTMAFPKNRG